VVRYGVLGLRLQYCTVELPGEIELSGELQFHGFFAG
jgi:hypothetical protein